MEDQDKVVKTKKDNPAGLFIPAGVFLGLAFGFWYGNIPFGLLAGLGIGFLLLALVSMKKES